MNVERRGKMGVCNHQEVGLCFSPYWVESESLESRLACVDVVVRLLRVAGQWSACVLLLRFSNDCRNDRRALSSSNGDAPSSSTSAISAQVTGWVLKRASRGRRGRLFPRAGPFGTGSCWGNSSMAEASRCAGSTWKLEVSRGIWRTVAMLAKGPLNQISKDQVCSQIWNREWNKDSDETKK